MFSLFSGFEGGLDYAKGFEDGRRSVFEEIAALAESPIKKLLKQGAPGT
jgi:hypothetical protein